MVTMADSSSSSASPQYHSILPHEKVFPVQVGSEIFRLSGASITSDGQSISTPVLDFAAQNADAQPISAFLLFSFL